MIRKFSFDDEIALHRCVTMPSDHKPRFNWREVVAPMPVSRPSVKIDFDGEAKTFELEEVAETIGAALTDLLVSRNEEDIFTEQNRDFVATVAARVAEFIGERINVGSDVTLSRRDIDLIIERTLVEQDAHDVARSLVARREELEDSNYGATERRDPTTVRLIRRNNQVVPWDAAKIETAVRKAFLSVHADPEPAGEIAAAVTERVQNLGEAFVHIETVQDLVEDELIEAGYKKVYKAYMLYRYERAKIRELEAAEAPTDSEGQQTMIMLRRADGSTEFWNPADLRKRIEFASIGLQLDLDPQEIERELRRSLYAEMSREELQRTIVLNAKTLLERDADFAKFAGRILLSYIYEEVLGWDIINDGIEGLKDAHRLYFRTYLERGVALERLNPELLTYDLDRLASALDPTADLDFDYLGVSTMYDRYLITDKSTRQHRRIETPQLFWMRVSMGLFLREPDNREDWVLQLYNLYKSRRFCSSTPTLFNAGTLHSQLSSCYLYKVDDSIESIMLRGIAENAFLSKWAGGLGGSWTSVRGTGSYIKGTNGESQGVIPFLKMHNDQLVAVNQGGKRKGSGCAYLETWHSDILDFLELRKNTGDDRRRTHDLNTANWIPDLFMKRMEAREDWTLFHANEVPELHECYGRAFEQAYVAAEARAEAGEIYGKKVAAIELWKSMLKMLFETGHPWITFKDPCNLRSPQDHAGVVHSSNLCTEITLNTSHDETAVCNLGSVVLDTHLDADGKLDLELLRETVRVAVRALDNVIDINYYPTEAAKTANSRHRPVGLGVMGVQNALYKMHIPFASDEAVQFNDEFMEAICFYAYEASSDLAAERGSYSTFQGSKWDRGLMPEDTLELLEQERGVPIEVPRGGKLNWSHLRQKIKQQGMRNSNVIAIAPTATISNIMGTSPCIEPYYRNFYVKSNLGGDFIVLNRFLVNDLKQRGLWTAEVRNQIKYFDGELENIPEIHQDLKDKYKTAFGIEFRWFIAAAARRQKWIDQSQSVNLFLAKPDLKTLSHMYRAAWRQGLKTTYYLRSIGASTVEKSTATKKKDMRGVIGQGKNGGAVVASSGTNGAHTSGAGSDVTKNENSEIAQANAERVQACRIDAMMNGGECEACQ
ncbi:MAG: ribonucleoside-diphosphate reductase subunit alpha [Opitutales bacterium]